MKIGFCSQEPVSTATEREEVRTAPASPTGTARRSLVRVGFEDRPCGCTYYNDRFDLQVGDLVFVSGSYAGVLGRVMRVTYQFRVYPSQYERVLSVADTRVRGSFVRFGDYFFSKEADVLPYGQVAGWFFPPQEEEEPVCGEEGEWFDLAAPAALGLSQQTVERAQDYFENGRVVYLNLKDGTLRAIVKGEQYYEVEFSYRDGRFTYPLCSCPVVGACKHSVATLMLLERLLENASLGRQAESLSVLRREELEYFLLECANPTLTLS